MYKMNWKVLQLPIFYVVIQCIYTKLSMSSDLNLDKFTNETFGSDADFGANFYNICSGFNKFRLPVLKLDGILYCSRKFHFI